MLHVAVAGGGTAAEEIHLPSFAAVANVSVVAIAELDDDRRRRLQQEFDVPHGYSTAEEMLTDADIDILSICTPPNTHRDVFVKGARRGLDIYCEKPLATTLSEAEEMLETARDNGIVTQIGYKHRNLNNMRRVFRIVKSRLLADLIDIEVQFFTRASSSSWRINPDVAGGGVMMDLFPHVFDVCLELMNEQPEIERVDLRSIEFDDIDDFANITLRFGKTTVDLALRFTTTADYRVKYLFTGSRGWVEIDDERDMHGSVRDQDLQYRDGSLPIFDIDVARRFRNTTEQAHQRGIESFVEAIRSDDGGGNPSVERGVEILETIEKIYRTGNI